MFKLTSYLRIFVCFLPLYNLYYIAFHTADINILMFQLNKTFVSYENCPLQICIAYTSSQGLDYEDREVKPMTGKKKEAQCRSQLICCRQREWGRLFL